MRSVEYLPLDEVLTMFDPQNAKDHALDLIDGSVERYGIIDNITRDDRTGKIISGHGRATTLGAQRDRGDTPPDGVLVLEDGTWTVPVNVGWASKNDDEARAALIVLNRATEAGGWVDDALLTALDALSGTDIDLTDVGFTDADAAILRRLSEAEGVFTAGAEHMLDEFRDASGQTDTDYVPEYAHKVAVYLRDAEAVAEFKKRLKITDDLTHRLHYPLDWQPYDRRQTWQQEREETGGE